MLKRLFVNLLALALLLCCAASAEAPEAAGSLQKDVIVLFTSDIHCGVDQNFGLAGLRAVKDRLSADNHVLLVDNGDSVQGEYIGIATRGAAIIEMMNVVGYDLAIPGNHDFDYGMDRFFELVGMADFPYISCNFNKKGELVFDPYVIREIDGVKIAFVGVTTPQTLTSTTPRTFQNENSEYIYGFCQDDTGEKVCNAVQKAVDDAHTEGAQYVIALGHMGNDATAAPWTYADIVANTNGIDAFLDGHSHDSDKVVMKNRDGANVPRQACGTKMNGIGWAKISKTDGSVDTGLYVWNNSVSAPDLLGIENVMTAEIQKGTEGLKQKLSEVIAVTAEDLTIQDPFAVEEYGTPVYIVRQAETNLGDLCADAYLDQSVADIALVNGGSIRSSIPKGDVTMGEIIDVLPFGNAIVVIEATGRQILDALEWGARSTPSQCGGFLQVAGLTYEIHTYLPSTCTRNEDGMFTGVTGEYRVKNVMAGGEPLDPDKTYMVAGNSFMLLDSGDGFSMFDGCRVQDPGRQDYQVLIDYIIGTLDGVVGETYAEPYGQGRIVAVEEPEA